MVLKRLYKWGLILGALGLYGCMPHAPMTSSVEARIAHAEAIALAANWHATTLHTHDFVFKAYKPKSVPAGRTLTIYIEGDGFAWETNDTPSDNPTPVTPMGLELAIHDKKNTPVVYLARACQFVLGADWGTCRMDYWTHLRFSPTLIQATNQAVDILKLQSGAKKIILIGYSGGGSSNRCA